MAEADYYLKIDGIDGEAESRGFEKNMQIESWSFGASNAGSASQGTGMGVGKATMQDFHFVVQNGKASLPLFLAVCKGTHISQATLTCRKTGGDGTPYPYLKVIFDNLTLSSFQTGGSNGSNILPMEQVSFNFAKITMEYSQQATEGGLPKKTNSVVYDVKKTSGEGA